MNPGYLRRMQGNVVWVLGAGFSASLGAPLLNGLFNPTDLEQLRRSDRLSCAKNDMADMLLNIYAAKKGELWQTAEDFIDFIDLAKDDALRTSKIWSAATALAGKEGDWLPTLQRLAAAQCGAFLEDNNLDDEHWGPYRRWAKGLDARDTVITFNWDRVLETLADPALGTALDEPRSFAIPTTDDLPENEPDVPQVLKLHGSVDWCVKGQKVARTGNPYFTSELSRPEEIAIATPGRSKRLATTGYLKPFWDKAKIALEQARAVVFVGYRFPPSDAWAREQILTSMCKGYGGPGKSVYTVLGPDVRSVESSRLGGLIEGTFTHSGWRRYDGTQPDQDPAHGCFSVRQLPLFAQDFMSIFSREYLLPLA